MHLESFAIDRHKVGPQSRCDSTKLRIESKKFSWVCRGETKRICQRYVQQAHAIAHRARHVEAASGEPPVLPRATPIPHRNFVAVESKCLARAADRWHRIRHQNWSAA